MPSLQKLLLEAIVVGLLLIPVAYVAGFIVRRVIRKPDLPQVCATWNVNYVMEWNLFIAGFLFHLLCQYSGLNQWYVQHYQ